MPAFSIRQAHEGDSADILAMIRELAEFERLAHEAVGTEAQLKRHLFSEKPVAEALIATDSAGRAIGFALFFLTFSTFLTSPGLYLEDLYVRPEARGSGAGLALLKALAKEAQARGCGRFEWSVLDWNVKAIKFYESLGAKPLPGWTRYRMTEDEIATLASTTSP